MYYVFYPIKAIFLLIFISAIWFLQAYVFLSEKSYRRIESIFMWTWSPKGKKIRDKEGYKVQQGKSGIRMGVVSLLCASSIYLVETTNVSYKIIDISFLAFVFTGVYSMFKLRDYY